MAGRRTSLVILSCYALLCALSGEGLAAGNQDVPLDSIPVYGYEVINSYPHDSGAFTQGLYYKDGYLYESTGLLAQSTVRKVIPETGEVVKIHHLPDAYYGEGLTVRNDTIYQLTYRNFTAFSYVELDTFAMVDSFPYALIGWGLTHDDTSLISSNGSPRLYHLNPQTYEEIWHFNVTAGGEPQPSLNEMEMIRGRIYANLFGSDSIAIIVPETGVVEGWIDLGGLRDSITTGSVLNGIAWDEANSRLFVTGKKWSHMFHIRVEPLDYPPEIVWSDPPSSFCTEVDSAVVLAVSVIDPDAGDTLEYTWTVNGVVDPAAQDSFYVYSSPVPTVDTVVVEVSDGMFTDHESWLAVVATAGIDEGLETRSAVLLRVQPNPLRQSSAIHFNIPQGDGVTQPVEITIHDVKGRCVSTLLRTELQPGEHTVFWNAADSPGKRVSPGIYIVTLKVAGAAVSRKCAVLD